MEVALALQILLDTFSDRPFFLASLTTTSKRSVEDLTDPDVELLTLAGVVDLFFWGVFSECLLLGPSGPGTIPVGATMELSGSSDNFLTS